MPAEILYLCWIESENWNRYVFFWILWINNPNIPSFLFLKRPRAVHIYVHISSRGMHAKCAITVWKFRRFCARRGLGTKLTLTLNFWELISYFSMRKLPVIWKSWHCSDYKAIYTVMRHSWFYDFNKSGRVWPLTLWTEIDGSALKLTDLCSLRTNSLAIAERPRCRVR